MKQPEVLALIPARGGSKSIPRKNLLRLAGVPLIGHAVAHARSSARITRIVVSTDDPEIADVARAAGAEVPFMRPSEYAQDDSPDLDVFRHALNWLRDHEGYACACVAHLRPTNPIRLGSRIDEAIDALLSDPDADSLRSVSVPPITPYKMWRRAAGYMEPVAALPGVAEPHSQARQSLPEIYWQNGYVDVVRPHVILELGLMAGRRVIPFVMHEPMHELDYPEAIAAAEAALRDGPASAPPPSHRSHRHPV